MHLTAAQYLTLKNEINADQVLASLLARGSSDDFVTIANAMNANASPSFWVWRTAVARAEIYNETSPDGTTWNWSTYKSQAIAEQNAWTQMFMGDEANFNKPNLRAGVAAIFTGNANANAQQAHILAMGRRLARRWEKLFAVGTGSTASPATFGAGVVGDVLEGVLAPDEISAAKQAS